MIHVCIGLVLVIYVICLLGGIGFYYPFHENYRPAGATLVVFILIGLLGFAVFGSPIK